MHVKNQVRPQTPPWTQDSVGAVSFFFGRCLLGLWLLVTAATTAQWFQDGRLHRDDTFSLVWLVFSWAVCLALTCSKPCRFPFCFTLRLNKKTEPDKMEVWRRPLHSGGASKDLWNMAFLCGMIVFGFSVVFYDHLHLWLDEYSQAYYSYLYFVPQGSAMEHQPPIDYVLQGLVLRLFGPNEKHVRLLVPLWSALAASSLFLSLASISGLKWIPLVICALIMMTPPTIRYLTESRPYMLSLFTSIVFFHLAIAPANSSQDSTTPVPTKPFDMRSWISLFSATLLVLLTIGAQSIFLVTATAIGLSVRAFLMPQRHESLRLSKSLSAILSALFCVVPFHWYIIKHSPPRLKPFEFDQLQAFFSHLLNFHFLEAMNVGVLPKLLFGLVSALFLMTLFLFNRFPRRSESDTFLIEKVDSVLGSFLVSALSGWLGLVAFSSFFLTWIEWPLYPKYIMVFLPALGLGVACSCRLFRIDSVERVHAQVSRLFESLVVFAPFRFLSLGAALVILLGIKTGQLSTRQIEDLPAMLDLIKTKVQGEAVPLLMFGPRDSARVHIFTRGLEFYGLSNPLYQDFRAKRCLFDFPLDRLTRTAAFIAIRGDFEAPMPASALPDQGRFNLHRFMGIDLIEIDNRDDDALRTLNDLLLHLERYFIRTLALDDQPDDAYRDRGVGGFALTRASVLILQGHKQEARVLLTQWQKRLSEFEMSFYEFQRIKSMSEE